MQKLFIAKMASMNISLYLYYLINKFAPMAEYSKGIEESFFMAPKLSFAGNGPHSPQNHRLKSRNYRSTYPFRFRPVKIEESSIINGFVAISQPNGCLAPSRGTDWNTDHPYLSKVFQLSNKRGFWSGVRQSELSDLESGFKLLGRPL